MLNTIGNIVVIMLGVSCIAVISGFAANIWFYFYEKKLEIKARKKQGHYL